MPYCAQFPLKLTLFPGEQLHLHIFESRYKSLINDCVAQDMIFGIPCNGLKGEMTLGTTVKHIDIVSKYEDGKMDIIVEGDQVYRIAHFDQIIHGKQYGGADIVMLEKYADVDYNLNQILIDLITELYQIMKIDKKVESDPYDFEFTELVHKIGLSLEQELQLLGIPSYQGQQDFLIAHLQQLIPVVKQMELMRKKIQMNGHFKQLKTLD